jgi:phosphoribosylaminoimidazole (AIR) synthetase
MQLSAHFQSSEFEKDGPMPAGLTEIFKEFCEKILEPIRVYINQPMQITSGYRSPAANAAAHGVPTSEHVATPRQCAADFTFDASRLPMRQVFDWIRDSGTLPFHQVIFEHGGMASIIHISYNLDKLGTRQALEGATYNASPYSSWEVAAYTSPQEDANGGDGHSKVV